MQGLLVFTNVSRETVLSILFEICAVPGYKIVITVKALSILFEICGAVNVGERICIADAFNSI